MLFVTLQQAKDHLRIDDDDSDDDLTLKITQAEAIITDLLKVDPAMLEGSPPLFTSSSPELWSDRDLSVIQSSVLLVLSALYDDEINRTLADYMADGGVIALLLARLRDPALA
jgi:hypothetical protein